MHIFFKETTVGVKSAQYVYLVCDRIRFWFVLAPGAFSEHKHLLHYMGLVGVNIIQLKGFLHTPRESDHWYPRSEEASSRRVGIEGATPHGHSRSMTLPYAWLLVYGTCLKTP